LFVTERGDTSVDRNGSDSCCGSARSDLHRQNTQIRSTCAAFECPQNLQRLVAITVIRIKMRAGSD